MRDEFDEAPFEYQSSFDKEKGREKVKQEFSLANGEIIKISISKFSDEHSEQFFMMNKKFKNMYETYSMFTLFTPAKVYDRYCRQLGGNALDT
mmetsp:Transcript_15769/g.19211  ORF Transcript_15769/g.19211 Transcript_15769/m.19211 type:complete len:93 (-) Transcript_15769:898-1176(-)